MNYLNAANGVLFNNLLTMVFLESKSHHTTAEAIRSGFSYIFRRKVGADASLFRKMSQRRSEPEDVWSFLRRNLPQEELAEFSALFANEDWGSHGDWEIVDRFAMVFMAKDHRESTARYWRFLRSLCSTERELHVRLGELSDNEQVLSSFFNERVADMMDLPGFCCTDSFSRQKFLIARVLYWGALADLYIQISNERNQIVTGERSSVLSFFLPELSEHGALIRSAEIFLDNQKWVWANQNGMREMSDTCFYEDITNASVNVRHRTLKPDIGRVKKAFQRWRSGTPLRLADLEKIIDPLYADKKMKLLHILAQSDHPF